MITRTWKLVTAFVVTVALISCGTANSEITVEGELQAEIVGQGDLVTVEEESSNTGNPPSKTVYLVVDRTAADGQAALDGQIDDLESHGWRLIPRVHEMPDDDKEVLFSSQRKVRVTVMVASDFLRQWDVGKSLFPEQRVAQRIRDKVPHPERSLVIAATFL